MFIRKFAAVALCGFALGVSPAFAGPEWIEQGDAGSRVSTGQKTFGSGQLGSISGSLLGSNLDGLGGGDFEDMFLITITNPAAFTMTVTAQFPTQIFLFNVTLPGEAFGLLGSSGQPPFMGNTANDGSGAAVNLPGVYAIAISVLGRDPVSNGGLIFNFANAGSPGEVSGPDGPGGFLPHTDWIGSGEGGVYVIHLTGATFYDLPSPGALALLGLAGMVGIGRRRR